jgi:hypothetical protein
MSCQVVMSNSSVANHPPQAKPAPKQSMWKKYRVYVGLALGWGAIEAALGAIWGRHISATAEAVPCSRSGFNNVLLLMFLGFESLIAQAVTIQGLIILGVGIVGGIGCLAYDYYHRKA